MFYKIQYSFTAKSQRIKIYFPKILEHDINSKVPNEKYVNLSFCTIMKVYIH